MTRPFRGEKEARLYQSVTVRASHFVALAQAIHTNLNNLTTVLQEPTLRHGDFSTTANNYVVEYPDINLSQQARKLLG